MYKKALGIIVLLHMLFLSGTGRISRANDIILRGF